MTSFHQPVDKTSASSNDNAQRPTKAGQSRPNDRSDPNAGPVTLRLKRQEIPFTDPASNCFFRSSADKPFLATPVALEVYGEEQIFRCLGYLRGQAEIHNGLDYLQVFECPGKSEPLWFIEDGPGGAITALLPSDY